jgi:hypothetical protein
MKHKEKLYFPDWDDELCGTIQYLTEEARRNNISEFDAFEAIHDRCQKWYFMCIKTNEVVKSEDCLKSECNGYAPNKSGRGVCKYRRMWWGKSNNKIHIKVE